MKKSALCLTLALALSFSMLTGCGSASGGTSGSTSESGTSESGTSETQASENSVTENTGSENDAAKSSASEGVKAGEYAFTEKVTSGNDTFETQWTLTLNEDGSYAILIHNEMMGDTNLTGTYETEDADRIITGTPNETDATILAGFFNEDRSCSWNLDPTSMTATPVLYTEGADAAGSGETPASDAAYANVAYADDSAAQVMDIYIPDNPTGNDPAIVLVHGGGFKFGDQEMDLIQPVIKAAVADGYVVATVDYRKSDEAVFPAALADVKAAVRYLRANASTYGINADRIAGWGESAGAYLALMTALTPEVSDLNGDVDDNLDQSSALTALVDFYGPVEFYTMQTEYKSWGDETDGSGQFESAFLGVDDIYSNQEVCDASYWETYKDQLPDGYTLSAWIQVGDENDTNVPYTQSVNFADRLKSVEGVTVEFHQIEGAGHEDDAFYTDENLADVLGFLDGIMK